MLVVVIGIICGATIPGTVGGTICTAIVGVGLVILVCMVFYDVGLTEDRERERQRRRLERDEQSPAVGNGAGHERERPRRPLRPERLRGQRRRGH